MLASCNVLVRHANCAPSSLVATLLLTADHTKSNLFVMVVVKRRYKYRRRKHVNVQGRGYGREGVERQRYLNRIYSADELPSLIREVGPVPLQSS